MVDPADLDRLVYGHRSNWSSCNADQKPDPVFLLPQVEGIHRYLNQATWYSLILAEIMTVVGAFIALPFALTTEKLSSAEIVTIF